ncbi:IclR family transcriptional regulator [Halopenitus salinus]|uniref:IclR family transcriptional regulator n=1 Tax=Halopenitus salinus TaxID=1198295 RepID=A0ABD5UYW8_9EURY
MTKNSKNSLQSIERSFDIIEQLVELESAGLTELSECLDIPKSTVYIHLQTLVQRGYVTKYGDDYRPSFRFLQLGGQMRHRLPLYRHGRPKVDELAQQTGELVNLAIEERGRGVVIYISKGQDAAINLEPMGKYGYLHQPAYGKAILAQRTPEDVNNIIDRHGMRKLTQNTISDRDQLHDELRKTRERGYALELDEGEEGLGCIGVAITDSENGVIGAVSISMPSTKISNTDVQKEMAQKLQNTANVIELKIEHT